MVRPFTAFGAFVALIAVARPLPAAPPPPPPSEAVEVARLLVAGVDNATSAQLSSFVANDVQAFSNGKLVASGKAQWTRYATRLASRWGELLTYSHGWEVDGASLMVLDRYDTVDRSDLPPTAIADPRFATRATLFQFGADHKIHKIQILIGAGTWINPTR